ncbi:hypothetical protein [Nocardia sp. CA-119907]|uniref:hypothetical protein n=1 Tax=Nocardia sp. CA-119907 TaxID=3239973 RepID=UPI003D9595E7
MNWFDIDGDGPYHYRHQYNEFHIGPCDQSTIRREITRWHSRSLDAPLERSGGRTCKRHRTP